MVDQQERNLDKIIDLKGKWHLCIPYKYALKG